MAEAGSFQTTIGILRRARSGDDKAVDELFERYLPRVRRIVALRLGTPLKDFATYEDIVQESLLRAFEKLDSFQEMTEGTFRNWMATCVMSAVNLYFRKEAAQKRGRGRVRQLGNLGREGLSDSIFKGKGPGASTLVGRKEMENRIETVLLSLEDHHREVIILRHLCEMTSREIADALGFESAATVRKVLSRAMGKLRSGLPDEFFAS